MPAAGVTLRCLVGAATLLLSASSLATPSVDRSARSADPRTTVTGVARQLLAEARTLEARGRLVAALSTMRQALAVMETSAAPEEALVEARVRVEELSRAVPRVAFVGVLPAGASVSVDGVQQGAARVVGFDPGEHEVVVEAPGRRVWRARFRLDRGDAREIAVQTGVAIGFDALPAVERGSSSEEASASAFLHAPATPPRRVAGDLRLAIAPIAVRAVRMETAGMRLCARETCAPTSARAGGAAGGDDRIDKTLLRQVVSGTGVNVTTHAGMVMLSTSDILAPNTRFAAGMTSEKAVLALTGRW